MTTPAAREQPHGKVTKSAAMIISYMYTLLKPRRNGPDSRSMMQKSLEQLNAQPPFVPRFVVTVTVGTQLYGDANDFFWLSRAV